MDPHTGVLPSLKGMVGRSARWKLSWQQSPLAACPQEVKDGVEDGTKIGGARSGTRSRRRQNCRNPGPRRVGQVGVVESRVHRTIPLARFSALSRQTSTFQTPSKASQVNGAFTAGTLATGVPTGTNEPGNFTGQTLAWVRMVGDHVAGHFMVGKSTLTLDFNNGWIMAATVSLPQISLVLHMQ